MTNRSREAQRRVKQMDALYIDTIEDAVISRHTQLTDTLPINPDFSLTIKGLPISVRAADILESAVNDFLDPNGATTSVRLGYNDTTKKFALHGIKANLKHADGAVSVAKLQGSQSSYVLSRPEPAMPDMPIMSAVVEPTFVDDLLDKLELDLPNNPTETDRRKWSKRILGHAAITEWHLRQRTLLIDDFMASEDFSEIFQGSYEAYKEIFVSPHRGGRQMKELRGITHEITVDTGDGTPVSHRDVLLSSSLSNSETSQVIQTFGIYQQSQSDTTETPLHPQPRTKPLLLQHLHRLDALTQIKLL